MLARQHELLALVVDGDRCGHDAVVALRLQAGDRGAWRFPTTLSRIFLSGPNPITQRISTMTENKVLADTILSASTETATIHAPLEAIDIADWLRNLPDKEYQRCAPPDHKAAGYTTTDDGRPMSINVEMIGTGLVIQHYVYEIAEKQHCHMVSLSDVLTPRGWTTVQVIWDLSVKDNGDGTLQYTNRHDQPPHHRLHGLQREERCHFRGSCGRPPSRLQRPQPTRDPAVRRQHRAQSSRLRPDHIRTTAGPDRREAGRGKPTQASVTFPHSFMIVAGRFEVCTWTALVQ